jgi:hypothetical protein
VPELTVLAQSLSAGFDLALGQLSSALQDCPAELWETDLWPDESPTRLHDGGALRGSAPWILAHHALVCLDYDLTGELSRWVPPAPIGDSLLYADPTRLFSKPELLAYLDHCRDRVQSTLSELTDELAATPVPSTHRYAGTLYGVLLGSIPPHVVEHAAQIRQFLRASGG